MTQRNEEISVDFSYTVNLGNYESGKIHVGLAREVRVNEDREEVIDKEFDFVLNKVFDKIDELLDKKER